jgi:AraC-like DNA-binding protein
MLSYNESDASLFDVPVLIQMRWLNVCFTLHDAQFCSSGRNPPISRFHSHQGMEVLLVLSGDGMLHVRDKPSIPVGEGSIVFVNQGVSHYFEGQPHHPILTYLILFTVKPVSSAEKIPQEWREDEANILARVLDQPFLVAEDRHGCAHEIEHILSAAKTHNLGELVKIKNYISNLLLSAFQSFADLPKRTDFYDILHKAPTACPSRITKYIRDHFAEDITLTSVANSLFYSPRQCSRMIQDSLGFSFFEFLVELRLNHAKKLLTGTNDSIEKIAECSGFKNGRCLSRLFQSREGITPYYYRKTYSPAQRGRVPAAKR